MSLCKFMTVLRLQRSLLQAAELPKTAVYIQFVRWRKARWIPPSPAKMWTVPPRPDTDPAELEKILVMYQHYRTTVKAIKLRFRRENEEKLAEMTDVSHVAAAAREYVQRDELNRAWNEETRNIREVRQAEKERKEDEKRMEEILAFEIKKERETQLAKEFVEKESIEAKTFIKPENLDDAIEQALNTRVNYNFAIDLSGNRYIEMPDGTCELADSVVDESNNLKVADNASTNV